MIKLKDFLMLVFLLTLTIVGTECWMWDIFPRQRDCGDDQCLILGFCRPLSQENELCENLLHCPCAPGLECVDIRQRPGRRPEGLRGRRPFSGPLDEDEPPEEGPFGDEGPFGESQSSPGRGPFGRRRPFGGRRGRWPGWRRRSRWFRFTRCVNTTSLPTTSPNLNFTVFPTTLPSINITFNPTTISDLNITFQPTTLPNLNITIQPTSLPDLNVTFQPTTPSDLNFTFGTPGTTTVTSVTTETP